MSPADAGLDALPPRPTRLDPSWTHGMFIATAAERIS